MKAGVENGHLGNLAEKTFDNFHAFQLGANVQRREHGNAGNG